MLKAAFQSIRNPLAKFLGREISRTILFFRTQIIRRPKLLSAHRGVVNALENSGPGRAYQKIKLDWLESALSEAEPLREPAGFEKPLVILATGSLGPGGSERQVVNTAIGLKQSGRVRVLVLCLTLRNPSERFFCDQLESENVEVRELRPTEEVPDWMRYLGHFLRRNLIGLSRTSLSEINAYAACFRATRPDVVHSWLDEINVKAGLGAVLAGVPRVILGSRSVAPYHFLVYLKCMPTVYSCLINRENVRLVCNSAAGKESYADWLRLPPDGISVIKNGFDSGYFNPPADSEIAKWLKTNELDPASPIVGTVTRFNEEKNPLLWIEFASLVAKQNSGVQFVMVGGGPLLNKAKRRAEQLGLKNRIRFTGLERDPKPALSAMDIFVLNSRLEGLPNVVIEAQAFGVPAVITNAGGARETIVPEVTGVVVESPDPHKIAVAVQQILDQPAWRTKAGERARNFAREMFSVERMIRMTLELYQAPRPALAEPT